MKTIRLLLVAIALMSFSFASNAQVGKVAAKKANYPGYKNQNGLYYRFFTKNEGATPHVGDVMEVHVACLINDTIPLFPAMENVIGVQKPQFAGDINEGFLMMHKGDSASLIVNIDSTFKYMFDSPLPSEFKSTDVMRWEVKLKDFYSEKEYAQKFANDVKARYAQRADQLQNDYPEESVKAAKELADFLVENKIVAKHTASGLYYVVIKPGNGERPEVGKTVTAHYTGKLLDGTVFDSSVERDQPFQFVLGVGQVIPGWDEGLQLMSKGEKGVLYIPYYLAYGERDLGTIPPFSNLIFEIELIDFETFE